MKKLILIVLTGAVLISCVMISTLVTGSAEQNTSAGQAVTEEKAFVIGIENGRVAVFREGEEKPFLVTDTYAKTLPEIDRKELEKGVEVSGEKELQKTLEDYCS